MAGFAAGREYVKRAKKAVKKKTSSVTKAQFIEAFTVSYGATRAEAERAWDTYDEDLKEAIVAGYLDDCGKAFWWD